MFGLDWIVHHTVSSLLSMLQVRLLLPESSPLPAACVQLWNFTEMGQLREASEPWIECDQPDFIKNNLD